MERKKSFLVNFKNRMNNKGVKNNPFHFIFFDTETDQKFEKRKIGKKTYKTCINTLQMGWGCYWNREEDTEEWFYFEKITDFKRWCYSVLKRTGKKQVWFVAHNIIFDNIITDIWSMFSEYETAFIHSKGMVYIQKLVQYDIEKRNKIIDGVKTLVEKKVLRKTVILLNNGNIFPTTLKIIGDTVDLPKMEVDFEHSSKEYVQKYCKRDVEILVKFWKEWCDFIDTYELGNIKYTISSQSMETYKKRFCNSYIILDDDMQNLEFERKAYYGGRTEIFHKGIVRKKIYGYDVNSMYPYVMKHYKYPKEFLHAKKNPTIEDVTDKIKRGYLVIAECNINTKRNCYPLKEDNTLKFPTGKFQTYLATPEVKVALSYGDIESFGRVSFYKGENIFEEYIDFFYNKRLELKALKNKQEKMIKLFLNSLYGKFGQMMDNWIKTTLEDIKQIDSNFDFDEWIMDNYHIPKILINGLDITPHIRFIGGQLQMSCKKEESQISFPAIAGHVTSYARLILWEVIEDCEKNNNKYYYCDTDSIFTKKPISERFIDENELGKLKLEKYFENGVEFINLKNYCELSVNGKKFVSTGKKDNNDKMDKIIFNEDVFTKESQILKGEAWKMKGVSNNAQMLDENTFIVQEWGGLPKQEYYKKFGRKAGEFWIIYKVKHNKGNINKGILLDNGDIIPFVKGDKLC